MGNISGERATNPESIGFCRGPDERATPGSTRSLERAQTRVLDCRGHPRGIPGVSSAARAVVIPRRVTRRFSVKGAGFPRNPIRVERGRESGGNLTSRAGRGGGGRAGRDHRHGGQLHGSHGVATGRASRVDGASPSGFRRVRDVEKATSLLSTFRSALDVCLDILPKFGTCFRSSKPKSRVQFPGERGAAMSSRLSTTRGLPDDCRETATVYHIRTNVVASRHSCGASER